MLGRDQAAIIKGVAAYLEDEPRLVGLFLAGSYGRGEDDAYSDVDFVAVVSRDHHEDLMEVWRAALENVARDMLITLMLEEVTKPDKGGAMHLSKLLPPEDFTELMSLPAPAPDRASVLATFKATASAFFPRAKRLAQELGIEWPETFEAKTRANLKRTVGLEFD